jgi:hypothetical protein
LGAVFDPIKDLVVEERFAQADEHHVLRGFAGSLDEILENLVLHIFLGLLVGFARAHGAVEVALRRCFDDVLHRKASQLCLSAQIAPQELCTVPSTHVFLL